MGEIYTDHEHKDMNSETLEIPCPVCCRTGFLTPPGPASVNVTDPCRTCGSTGWIIVDKYKYLKDRL